MEIKRDNRGKQAKKTKSQDRVLKAWQDTKVTVHPCQTTLTCVSGRIAVTYKAGKELRPGDSIDLTNCSDVKVQAIEPAKYNIEWVERPIHEPGGEQ